MREKKKLGFALALIWFFILIFYFSGDCVALNQGGFQLRPRDKPFGLHFIDGERGWIVGDAGLVLKTTDGGKSWLRVFISDEAFRDVFFIDEYKGWIVGDRGVIFHTDDGGTHWFKQSSGVVVPLMSVFFVDRDHGFVVGADETILRTANGGASWERVPLNWMDLLPDTLVERGVITINLYDIFFLNEASGWIVGDYGTILTTKDGGNSWHISNIGPYPSLFSIFFKDEREGWAVGQNGFSLRTRDGGRTWGKAPIGTEESLYCIRVHGDYGVVVGDHGVIFTSNNGGATWVKKTSNLKPPFPWLVDAWIFTSSTSARVLIVGKGIILEKQIHSRK